MTPAPDNASPQPQTPDRIWMRRLLISLTSLAWITIIGIVLWVIGLIIVPILLIVLSMIIAYILFPLVKFFARHMPRAIAILLTYIIVFVGLLVILFAIIFTALVQLFNLVQNIYKNLPAIEARLQPLLAQLTTIGISPKQFSISGEVIIAKVLHFTSGLVPFVGGLFTFFIACVIVTSVSVYFLIDGQRFANWLHRNTPLKERPKTAFFLRTLNKTMGGVLRGQLSLATITTSIVGIGFFIIGVPYAMLFIVIVFIFEFVPQIGTYISGTIVVLFTLALRGWQTGLIVAVFVSIVQGVVDGQILAPRLIGKAVGLHPIISVFAILIGAALFGLTGAIFAAPIAGIIQAIVQSYWTTWKQGHRDQFPEEEGAEVRLAGRSDS